MVNFCKDEGITNYSTIKGFLLTGGLLNLPDFSCPKKSNKARYFTLGERLKMNLNNKLESRSLYDIQTVVDKQPQHSIVKGARILMNL